MTYQASKIRLILELRQSGISNTSILSAIEKVPREVFILRDFIHRAYENTALPIYSGQTISQPYVVAFMTQALELTTPTLKVLEIGTGSGYQAAILAQLVRRVYSLERHRLLMQRARNLFNTLKLYNITNKLADGFDGWPQHAPFDRIIATCAADLVPQPLMDQLAIGGIMVLPIEDGSGGQVLTRYVKTSDGIEEQTSLPVRFVPMLRGTTLH